MKLRRLLWHAALLLLISTCLPGCAAMQWYARQTGKGAVRGFYEGMASVDDPLRKKVINDVLSDPALRQVAHDITASVVGGAVDGLTQAKLDQLAGSMVQNTMKTLREQGDSAMNQFVREAGPMLDRALRRGIEDAVLAMGTAMHKTAQEDMGEATTLLVRAAIEGLMQSLTRAGRELTRDLDDKTERFLTQKVAPGAGQVARTFTREAVLGIQEGLAQGGLSGGIKDQLPTLRMVMHEIGVGLGEGLGVGIGRSVQKSPIEPLLTGIAVVLGILLTGAVVGLILMWRRYLSTSKSLELFAHEINEAQGNEQIHAQELRRQIRDAHATANHVTFLDKFLKHRGLYRPIGKLGGIENPDYHDTSTPPAAASSTPLRFKQDHEAAGGPDGTGGPAGKERR